jgi:ribonuclease P protein component
VVVLRRLVHKVDFEALMATPPWSRSAHFALHYLSRAPAAPRKHPTRLRQEDLSTEVDNPSALPVDKPLGLWIGAVVPKRHARRSVTRSLVKRQVREAFRRHGHALPPGLWLVRLRRLLAPAQFPSARSDALAEATRRELDELLSGTPGAAAGSRRARPGAAPRR